MASKRRLRRKACTGKQRFASQGEATNAMLAFKRRKGIGEWLTAYRCRFCNGFHFGHPPAHVREAIAHNQMERSFKGNHVTEVMARMRRERTKRAA